MKAYTIENFGFDGLKQISLDEPTPGPRQVVVRLNAVALNYRDLMVVKGVYNPRMKLPSIPFSDGAGTVVAVGSDVTRFRTGDRVTTTFFEHWVSGPLTDAAARSALGGGRDGVLQEFIALDQDGVIATPRHLSDEEAATLPCAGLTAWNALFETGRLKPGDTVLLLGTGGVSVFALQFALAAGARVIITSSSDEKLDHARTLGAHFVVNYLKQPEWQKTVRDLTDGAGVDNVIEVGGAGTFARSVATLRRGSGVVSLIGVLAGGGNIDMMPVLMNSLTVHGIFVGSRVMFEAMNAAIAHRMLTPVVYRTFAFAEVRAALEFLESGSHFGKVVLKL